MTTTRSPRIGIFVTLLLATAFSVRSQPNIPVASPRDRTGQPGAPVIQFENTFFDFGKINTMGSLSESFRFKNAGNAVLKLEPPKPSCGCTDARAVPDVLAPGQSGQISYQIKLDHPMGQVQKHISIYSNDPKNPDIQLTMQLDYTPSYELNPKILRLTLPPNRSDVEALAIITRTDGLPPAIASLSSSAQDVTAQLDGPDPADPRAIRVKVKFSRPAKPAPNLSADIQFWESAQTNRPLQKLLVVCALEGELSASPAQTYWVLPNLGTSFKDYPPESLTRTVKLKSVLDQPVAIKEVKSNIQGLVAEIRPREAARTFDLTLKFSELPHGLSNGKVTIETGTPGLPKVEIPVTVAVAQ
jgi:hypothetical protein